MTLSELRQLVREMVSDVRSPPMVSDFRIRFWLNEAQREACLRARLLRENNASSRSTITTVADTAEYALDDTVQVVQRAWLSGENDPPLAIQRDWASDELWPSWRTETGRPRAIIPDITSGSITIAPVPDAVYTIGLQLWRLPTTDEELLNDTDSPVIKAQHHPDLVHWVCYRIRNSRDLEIYEPDDALYELGQFEAKFGPRPSAETLERWQFERPQKVRAQFI